MKEVLEHLVTPSSKDVDSILLELRNPRGEIMSSYDTYINYSKEDLHKLYLPPFPWSLPQCGSNKSSTDNTRLLNMDNCWQRWVTQRSSTSLHCNNRGTSFQGLDFLPGAFPSQVEKIDGLVYDGAPLSMVSFPPIFMEIYCQFCFLCFFEKHYASILSNLVFNFFFAVYQS